MTDIVETLKTQLRKGYELGDGNLCLVGSRDLEAFIAEIEGLRTTLRGLLDEVMCFAVDPPSAALNHAIEEARRALEPKP